MNNNAASPQREKRSFRELAEYWAAILTPSVICWLCGHISFLPRYFTFVPAAGIFKSVYVPICDGMLAGIPLSVIVFFVYDRLCTMASYMKLSRRVPLPGKRMQELGITSPLDFCVYMATEPFLFRTYTWNSVTLTELPEALQADLRPDRCETFRTLYGRGPGGELAQKENSWAIAALEEAARAAELPLEKISDETLDAHLSERFRGRIHCSVAFVPEEK